MRIKTLHIGSPKVYIFKHFKNNFNSFMYQQGDAKLCQKYID